MLPAAYWFAWHASTALLDRTIKGLQRSAAKNGSVSLKTRKVAPAFLNGDEDLPMIASKK